MTNQTAIDHLVEAWLLSTYASFCDCQTTDFYGWRVEWPVDTWCPANVSLLKDIEHLDPEGTIFISSFARMYVKHEGLKSVNAMIDCLLTEHTGFQKLVRRSPIGCLVGLVPWTDLLHAQARCGGSPTVSINAV